MFVIGKVWTQRVPCGTSPKLWTMSGGGACSRLVLMSGRKNLFAHGAGVRVGAGEGGTGCCPGAAPPATSANPSARQYDRLIRRLLQQPGATREGITPITG